MHTKANMGRLRMGDKSYGRWNNKKSAGKWLTTWNNVKIANVAIHLSDECPASPLQNGNEKKNKCNIIAASFHANIVHILPFIDRLNAFSSGILIGSTVSLSSYAHIHSRTTVGNSSLFTTVCTLRIVLSRSRPTIVR